MQPWLDGKYIRIAALVDQSRLVPLPLVSTFTCNKIYLEENLTGLPTSLSVLYFHNFTVKPGDFAHLQPNYNKAN